MGRPKGSLNKATLARQQLEEAGIIKREETQVERLQKLAARMEQEQQRSYEEIIKDIQDRFDALTEQVNIGLAGKGRGVLAYGAPGIGKTYTVEELVTRNHKKTGHRFFHIKGRVTPVQLYSTAYNYSAPGEVIIMDDADAIFDDVSGLNLLKAMLDTSPERTVSWLTANTSEAGESQTLGELPSSFIYKGFVAFMSNLNFNVEIAQDTKKAIHLRAIENRAHVLNMKINTSREIAAWTRHIVLTQKIFQKNGIDDMKLIEEMLKFIDDNAARMKYPSIRTAIKMAEYFEGNPARWRERAGQFLFKED